MDEIGLADVDPRYIAAVAAAPDLPIVLLPPSEGKAPGGARHGGSGAFARRLARPRTAVRRALALALDDEAGAARVLGVRGDLLDVALVASRQLVAGRPPLLPAWQRYTGVVWGHLDPASLAAEHRERILVPSGLYGVTTAEDRIADYRLKLSVSLDGIGNLARFWRPSVTRALEDELAGRTVVAMLPEEHVAAVDLGRLAEVCELVEVRFVGPTGSRSVGHVAKATKGLAARATLLGGLPALEAFRADGWTARRTRTGVDIVGP
jgi:hypothetical protein